MTISFQAVSSTYAHGAGVSEQTALTFTPTANNIVKGIWLDLTNLTQSCIIRVKYQIDGTNFRVFQSIDWNTSMDDGVLIDGDIPVAASKSLRITVQSGTTEGTSRNIPIEYWTEGLGSGVVTYTYHLSNSVTSAPIAGAQVWVSSDVSGSQIISSGLTDSSGDIIFYLNNNQTYYFWRVAQNLSFSNPDTETVNS